MSGKEILLTAFAVLLAPPAARADILLWPLTDPEWNPIFADDVFLSDPLGDASPAWTDMVGDTTTFATGYSAFADAGTPSPADDELMWRIRLDDSTSNAQTVWQILMDTTGDGLVDWSLQLDLSGDNRVELVAATSGGPTYDDVVLDTTAAWSGSVAGFSRTIDPAGDGSGFGGDPDAFVDIGIPWSDFSTATGLGDEDFFRIALTTSSTHSGINKDLPLAGVGTDVIVFSDFFNARRTPEARPHLLVGGGLLALGLARRRTMRRSRPARPSGPAGSGSASPSRR